MIVRYLDLQGYTVSLPTLSAVLFGKYGVVCTTIKQCADIVENYFPQVAVTLGSEGVAALTRSEVQLRSPTKAGRWAPDKTLQNPVMKPER